MYKPHKIRLNPNNKQITYFMNACGVARFAYNWALDEWISQYAAHQENPEIPKPNQYDLRKKLNSIKAEQFPWMKNVTKCAPQAAIIALGIAWKNYFEGRAERPKFKKKNRSKHSFKLDNTQFNVEGKRIWVPKLGWVKMREELRFAGKLVSATISQSSGQWFVSISVDMPDRKFDIPNRSTGIDLGITNLAILSNGETFDSPKFHRVELKRIRKLNKELSRRTKFSKNWNKTKSKLAALHAKIANQRSNHMHKLTTSIANRFNIIGMETLNVAGMVKNHSLARSVQDQGFGEFKRQMKYKCEERKTTLIEVGQWFPSSKKCSDCGFKNQGLTLKVRAWTCGSCGSNHDRDINASINIEQEALRILRTQTGSSSGLACGDGSAGEGVFKSPGVKLLSVKQESNTELLRQL